MICRCVTESDMPGWVVVRRHDDGAIDYEICPECGGSMIASCCNGAGSAQPELEEEREC